MVDRTAEVIEKLKNQLHSNGMAVGQTFACLRRLTTLESLQAERTNYDDAVKLVRDLEKKKVFVPEYYYTTLGITRK